MMNKMDKVEVGDVVVVVFPFGGIPLRGKVTKKYPDGLSVDIGRGLDYMYKPTDADLYLAINEGVQL